MNALRELTTVTQQMEPAPTLWVTLHVPAMRATQEMGQLMVQVAQVNRRILSPSAVRKIDKFLEASIFAGISLKILE